MSLSSDTEGPPAEPLPPSLSYRIDPDIISEEEGEGDPTPGVKVQIGVTLCLKEKTEMDSTKSEVEARGGKGNADTRGGGAAARIVPKSEAKAQLNYDSVKHTLVVGEHAQFELLSLKDCLHSHNEHNDDSDTETVYQSANEEEDPEYEEERKRREDARKQGKTFICIFNMALSSQTVHA